MAKRNEFKPDKMGGSFLGKLYLTKNQRKTILKWSLYALVLLILSLLQDVVLCKLDILGATTDLVPVGITLVCLLEGAQRGCIFTAIASALFVFSGGAPGMYSMVFLTFLVILISIFRQAYLQKGFGTALLCVSVCLLLYEMANFAMGLFLGLTSGRYFAASLVTAVLSMVSVPVLYPICLSIESIGGETWKE